jgi:hypothetical protein
MLPYVRLRHADYNGKKLQTRYAHLLKRVVELGDAVTEGQLIGYSGASGNCYGAHLHFEVLYKGRRVNPLNWLDADFTPASAAVRRHLGSYTSVARPADAEPAANALQTVQANGLTNAEAMSVYSLALALGLVGLGLYSAEYADAAHTKQNLRIGPVSAGDAKALMDKLTELGAADKAAPCCRSSASPCRSCRPRSAPGLPCRPRRHTPAARNWCRSGCAGQWHCVPRRWCTSSRP